MILDSLKNSALYYSVNPRMKKAFELFAATDWMKKEPGIYELDGKDIFVNLMEREMKEAADAKLEVHNEYIDVQVVLCGKESYGWSERCNVHKAQGEFNAEKDVLFYDDEPQTYFMLTPGQFTILLPEDAHAPLVGTGVVRKAIIKVRVK